MKPADFDRWLSHPPRSPLLMGILNATPDSFSDGGTFFDKISAIRHADAMIEQGASIIDVGGESTRPGADPVDAQEQIRRTLPVVEHLAQAGAVVSIDTTSADVARAAIGAGATIINDVSAGRDDAEMFPLAAKSDAAIVLMHMLGSPKTMQQEPVYSDVVSDVLSFLEKRAEAAVRAGIERSRILLDVGIGFGKTLEHNLELLREHRRFADRGYATVLGTSRKGFLGSLTKRPAAAERVMGTAATIAWGITNGADILRVHDVREMREVVDVILAIRCSSTPLKLKQ